MKSRRTAKVAQAVLESVSSAILFGLKDPRVRNVTVVRVDVKPDIRSAKVYVSIMGDEKTRSLSMRGLNSARGYLQAKVADRLQTRYTPVLKFVLDDSVKKSMEAARIISEVLPAAPDSVEDSEHDSQEQAAESEHNYVDGDDDRSRLRGTPAATDAAGSG